MELAISSSSVAGLGARCKFSLKKIKDLLSSRRLRYPHVISDRYLHFHTSSHTASPKMVASATKMVSNTYRGRDSSIRLNNKIIKLDSCLVIPPTPNRGGPRAIIKFLGGAFIGAVPEVTYGYLVEYLAKEGFLVVLVPYNVTFDHAQATKQVHERFQACFDTILTSGLPEANLSPAQLGDLPLFSVGHSNGALLQLLIGSYFSEKIPKANAIISYNNRPATEAVPYFEQLGPVVSQMMPAVVATPAYAMATNATGDAWKTMLNVVGSIVQETEREVLTSLTKFVDQLPSVMNEVTQGVSEFKPTPSENRECFKSSYNVEHTLLVKFSSDTIDETDILEETLRPRVDSLGGTLEKVQLSGNHITPCMQDPKWQVGDLYTPADAIAQGLKSLSLYETKILARTISDWFRRLEG
ncbi:hypothetical protein QN277_017726 [Acacia crassicarpa]|uniref:DUF1350 domain-containing protein n=1 Tax=Acacia crassicarpa TaxID=499986 RepID=A0AAE1KGL1_9FABA|nr:hypothetical protein QN277_017726 [Acacia crassicarpa]